MPLAISASSKQTHYDILKIKQSATQEEIKFAYRSLIINCHPDKQTANNTDKEEENITCEEVIDSLGLSAIDIDEDTTEDTNDNSQIDDTQSNKNKQTSIPSSKTESISNTKEEEREETKLFHNIQAAYNCLRDPMKRRQYDEHISRNEEKELWRLKGAIEVNLSDMECDWCCVVDEDDDNDSDNTDDERNRGGSITHDINDDDLQKVFFHPCRCGDTFQIVREELLESIDNTKSREDIVLLTNRVWQCDSCCLTIQIHVDDINTI